MNHDQMRFCADCCDSFCSLPSRCRRSDSGGVLAAMFVAIVAAMSLAAAITVLVAADARRAFAIGYPSLPLNSHRTIVCGSSSCWGGSWEERDDSYGLRPNVRQLHQRSSPRKLENCGERLVIILLSAVTRGQLSRSLNATYKQS
jgi:hypothetical protein